MSLASSSVDLEVFRKYAGLALPRHVSYPMPTWWTGLSAAEASDMRFASRGCDTPHALSIYLHIPFCERLCRYCACNRVIQRKGSAEADDRTQRYVDAVEGEIRQVRAELGERQIVRQIHWGGGTPTYLTPEQFRQLHECIADAFTIAPDAEIAIEADPRVTTRGMLKALRELGFSRVSLGVQDFDPVVQEHVRRVQPFEMVRDTLDACREFGFTSVNFDLIYGMPFQTPETIKRTIEETIVLNPDRIAYYHYAQVPDKVATQRGLAHERMPDSETKLEMFLLGVEMFQAAGYEFIGLDHFAKPEEPLAQAVRTGDVQRNFQGMTTGAGLDLVGVGASSISHFGGLGFLQNVRDTNDYVTRLEAGQSPTFRGKHLTEDDVIRQTALSELYCYGVIRPQRVETKTGVSFAQYFARELEILRELEPDGLVRIGDDGAIEAMLPLGRVLIRNIAAVFDAYLEPDAYRAGDRQYFSANA